MPARAPQTVALHQTSQPRCRTSDISGTNERVPTGFGHSAVLEGGEAQRHTHKLISGRTRGCTQGLPHAERVWYQFTMCPWCWRRPQQETRRTRVRSNTCSARKGSSPLAVDFVLVCSTKRSVIVRTLIPAREASLHCRARTFVTSDPKDDSEGIRTPADRAQWISSPSS